MIVPFLSLVLLRGRGASAHDISTYEGFGFAWRTAKDQIYTVFIVMDQYIELHLLKATG